MFVSERWRMNPARCSCSRKVFAMALRGVKPTEIQKRLKAMFYGPAGIGKTTAAIQFPRPYLIDCERGAENSQYVKLLNDAGGAYYATVDPDEMITEVHSLMTEKHEFRTLVIDPLTMPYNELLDRSSASLKSSDDPTGTAWGRHKVEPDRKIKHLLNLLLRLDMNVIITSHAKPNWVRSKDGKGKDVAVQEGITFDCYGRIDYLFDLVLEVGKRGKDRIATVRKTRLEGFPEGDVVTFNYAEIAARYGRELLEKAATPEALASAEQVEEITRLVRVLQISDAVVSKWLDKAKAEAFNEMPASSIVACINWCQAKIDGKAGD